MERDKKRRALTAFAIAAPALLETKEKSRRWK